MPSPPSRRSSRARRNGSCARPRACRRHRTGPTTSCPASAPFPSCTEKGSALNRHVHLHGCVTDGVFSRTATGEQAEPGVTFLPARPITPGDLDTLTARVRKRLIRWFRRAGLLDTEAAADMLAWEHSGFSIDALRADLPRRPRGANPLHAPAAQARAVDRAWPEQEEDGAGLS